MQFELRGTELQTGEPVLPWILHNRGIKDIDSFLEASESWVGKPTDLDNIEKAYQTLMKNEGKILTIVDSDMDGYCSSAILWNYLNKAFGLEIDYFIHEGKQHGISDALEKIDEGYSLVFVPDAGSNDGRYMAEFPNTTFIVLDHHDYNTDNPVSDNMVLVNAQLSPKYGNKSVSGTGVTWQFLRYIDEKQGTNFADNYWDMVAVSIVSDMMELSTLENRAILERGLKDPTNNMILALGDKASYQLAGELTPKGVAFYVAPLVNAMCRVGTLDQKERMFLAFAVDEHYVESQARGSNGELVDVATESARECVNAKGKQSRLRDKMANLSEGYIDEYDLEREPILVVSMDSRFVKVPTEMNGLSAQEISKRYDRPVLLGRVNSEGYLRGSVRAPEQIPVKSFKDFLAESNLFEYTEGHASAFGYSIHESKLNKLNDYFHTQWDAEKGSISYPADYIFDKITPELKQLCQTRYENRFLWGRGMEEPKVGGRLSTSQAETQILGRTGQTVKITKGGIDFLIMKMPVEEVEELITKPYYEIEFVGECDLNHFRGTIKPQVKITDYEIKERSQFLF